jgi:hypothetical protein
MQASPAISVNGGRLPTGFLDKVRRILPEHPELIRMMEKLEYVPESDLPDDEALREENFQPGHDITEKFLEIMRDLEVGNDFHGNLVDYFALRRHDPEAFALLSHAAELTEAINHLYEEFLWLINGDGHADCEIWSLEGPRAKLISATSDCFI